MADWFEMAFSLVWFVAILVSIPAGFAAGYFIVAANLESAWLRVILGTLLGFVIAPIAFFAAYLLPVTVWVIIPAAFLLIIVYASDRRSHPNPS